MSILPSKCAATLSLPTLSHLMNHPFFMLPESLRPSGLRTWAAYKTLGQMDNGFALCAMISAWLGQGVPEQAVADALAKVLRPAAAKEIKYASDLTAALAELIAGRTRYDDETTV